MTVAGVLLLLSGVLGWLWSNPLQVELLAPLALLRGSVNVLLAAGGGVLVPMLYTWFVAGDGDPTMTARGFAAGAIAGLAASPFVPSSMALLVGVLAGATVPFVTYVLDQRLRLDDATGLVAVGAVPAILGLLLAGLFADGASGMGWQRTGMERYLGVAGQGVTGLLAGAGYQPDFPGQLQAQVMGIAAIGLWGFLSGLVVVCPWDSPLRTPTQSARRCRRVACESVSAQWCVDRPGWPQVTLHEDELAHDEGGLLLARRCGEPAQHTACLLQGCRHHILRVRPMVR